MSVELVSAGTIAGRYSDGAEAWERDGVDRARLPASNERKRYHSACMPSERIQRRIDRLLDEAEAAADGHEWQLVRELSQRALALDKRNDDARSMLAMAAEELGAPSRRMCRMRFQYLRPLGSPTPPPPSRAAGTRCGCASAATPVSRSQRTTISSAPRYEFAARITNRAEQGQVLVSDVVRQLCAGKTFDFTSQGDVTLKGFDEPVTLYEVKD